ncbi:esterase/lipase family protein [Litorivivens sp.]|uniref:esterase/lipase family protein n=1 Tax=Litorivivens sp. TaxID=2020868 RepID=UPI00356AE06B
MFEKKPKALHTILESRFAVEALAHVSSKPFERLLPRGDGHPVLVIPAFLTSDAFTASLRNSLSRLGYDVHAWQQGLNTGLHHNKLVLLRRHLKEIVLQRQQKITIIGWSLGGIYARALAAENGDHIRQVITLGSPFGIPVSERRSDAVQGLVSQAFQLLNRGAEDPMVAKAALWQKTPAVPCTSIYTESDGIVHWHYCVDQKHSQSENIRVPGSHIGLTHNPAVLYLLADRLQQRAESWQAFNTRGWRERLFNNQVCAKAIELAETSAPSQALPA